MSIEIDIFIHREGQRGPSHHRVEDGVSVAALKVLVARDGEPVEVFLFEEDADEPLHDHHCIRNGGDGYRILHHGRCEKVHVSVRYGGPPVEHAFGPGTTISRVKRWAERRFEIDAADANDLALQIQGTVERPDESVHVGSLVHHHHGCRVAFDLLPDTLVNGAVL